MSRSRGVLLSTVLATMLGACATSGDTEPPQVSPEPAQAPPTGPTETAPSLTTGPAGADPRSRSNARASTERSTNSPPAARPRSRGATWHSGCPIPLGGLRLLHFNYWGFGGNLLRGPMVVNATVGEDVLWVFHQLYDARFPIKRVSLSTRSTPRPSRSIGGSTATGA